MATHKCDVPHCDGTRLGHELAVDFPEETARIQESINRIANREDYVMPENLQADLPIHRTEAGYPRCSTCDGGGCLDCTDPA